MSDILRYRSNGVISFGDINEALGVGRTASRTIGGDHNSAYQALSYRSASTPYINKNTPKFSHWYNYYERPVAYRGTASSCLLDTSIIPTIFNQTAPLYSGIAGGTYTYTGTVQDLTAPSSILTVAVVSTLPGGWTFTQTSGTNTFTVSGPVPAGADYIITLQVSSSSNSSQQTISINAVYATLKSMEFKISYRSPYTTFSSAQASSIKTTSPITISIPPVGIGQHSCDRAQFNLVAGIYNSSSQWEWTNLGKINLNNSDPGNTYNIFDANIPALALLTYTSSVPTSWLDTTKVVADDYNRPVSPYNSTNKLSYYNTNSLDSDDRTVYIDISNDMATTLSNKSNWVGSPYRGIVKIKLTPNSYKTDGTVDIHTSAFGWMQVFKKNLAGTNQEEVLNSGSSFIMAGTVVVTADIINNTVTVTQ